MVRIRVRAFASLLAAAIAAASPIASAQQAASPTETSSGQSAGGGNAPPADQPLLRDRVFDMGEIVVIGTTEGIPGVGGAILSRDQMWTFDRNSLDQAVNIVPGVISNMDSNGRRNESDIFVRGFGRWQVPLTLDGVRIYLPADNRLDFSRFLTADIAEVQVQKGYASVLDGPGGMGGAINLVTRKPSKPFEVEGSISGGGRSEFESSSGYLMVGSRQSKYYVQGSANYSDRDFWSLSGDYRPTANSLQPVGRRQSSDSNDSRYNVKAGFTPRPSDEYTFNFTKQLGEKGAPLNVFNNPPVPANGYWLWPYWDIQNTSFLSKTQFSPTTYLKTRVYGNAMANEVSAFDDITYTTQSANGRFNSPYDDHSYGVSAEVGTTHRSSNTIKAAVHYRRDIHVEQSFNRPTHPTLSTTEPEQTQSQNTWSIAAEDTFHATSTVDVVAGLSYDKYEITKAEEFNTTRGLFEYPRGGSDAFNWQGALVWHYSPRSQVHASVSDRARFPMIFELYSTRFGTATPNPDLGPERATNVEFGWKGDAGRRVRLESAVFYSDIRDLNQTVTLPDNTTQYQNVGNGEFYGVEMAIDAQVSRQLSAGGNYTALKRTITDALQPNLRPTGVPTHKAFLYAAWKPVDRVTITPTLDIAGDRWSDVSTTPVPAFPYVRIGSYTLLNLSAQYTIRPNFDVVFGYKNLTDDFYSLSWGLPQQGRNFYFKTRVGL